MSVACFDEKQLSDQPGKAKKSKTVLIICQQRKRVDAVFSVDVVVDVKTHKKVLYLNAVCWSQSVHDNKPFCKRIP